MEKTELAAVPAGQVAAPAGDEDKIFAQMQQARSSITLFRRLTWWALALYPLEFLVMFTIPEAFSFVSDADTGGMILFGFMIIAGPQVISHLFRMAASSSRRHYDEYSGVLKTAVVRGRLEEAFKNGPFANTVYEPDKGLSKEEIQGLNFFAHADFYSSDDRIEGEYENLRFSHTDCSLVREETHTDKDRDYKVEIDVFRGRVLRFPFGKPFPGDLRIVSRNFAGAAYESYSMVTVMGKKRVQSAAMAGWENVETESFAFNEEYVCFAKDPVAALVILKPQVIAKIFDLRERFKLPLALYFRGDEVFAFLHTGMDTFAVDPRRTLEEEKEKVDWDIKLMVAFLEVMSDVLPGN